MVAVLLIAGLQVPLIPLLEVVGSGAKVARLQIVSTCVKTGVTAGVIFRFTVKVVSQVPPVTSTVPKLF
ncbi:hypothetical protein D9M69_692010 [compost metagenome]